MKKLLLSLLVILLLAAGLLLRPHVLVAQGGPPDLVSQIAITRSTDQSTYVLQTREEQVNLALNETATIEVQLSAGNGVVHIVAPETGLLNGQPGKLDINTDQVGRNISFTFSPGNSGGRFYLEVSDGQRFEPLLDLWVGPERMLGQPGPALTFVGDQ